MSERNTVGLSRLRSSTRHREGDRIEGSQRRHSTTLSQEDRPHIQIEEPVLRTAPSGPSIYLGSYGRSTGSVNRRSVASTAAFSKTTVGHLQLQPLLRGADEDCDTYGIHEMRDGFFDAIFYRPPQQSRTELFNKARESLPSDLRSTASYSIPDIIEGWWIDLIDLFAEITKTRAGVRLFKSFLGVFMCYVICLIPAARIWLGGSYYILAVSALFNHPGRSVGSQIDGAVTSILGVIVGLLWGSFAVWTAAATTASVRGYGAAVAPFLVVFSCTLGWLRCVLNRLWQAILAAGIAFFYTCLAQDFALPVQHQGQIWSHGVKFLIPWVLGQAACFLVCVLVFPSAGNRPLALAFHSSLVTVKNSLVLPRPDIPDLNRELSWQFVYLSQAARDFMLDLSFSPFNPGDVSSLRNLLQGVLRAMLAVKPDTKLFDMSVSYDQVEHSDASQDIQFTRVLAMALAPASWKLVETSSRAIEQIDSVLIRISGIFGFASKKSVSARELRTTLEDLQNAESAFDQANSSLAEIQAFRHQNIDDSDILNIYLFVNPVRQAAEAIHKLLAKVVHMVEQPQRWQINLPSYPWSKAILRMNPTVRHDRGGVTAATYFRSKQQLAKMMQELQSRPWAPLQKAQSAENDQTLQDNSQTSPVPGPSENREARSRQRFQHRRIEVLMHDLWSVMHRLQDFETRFAIKKTLVCTLLSIPAFLPQSSSWWYSHDCWWSVITVWIMMHPRVGGNLQDLLIRTFCAFLGALWAALAHAAGSGNPYVTAVLGAMFLLPMIYRYTLSSHPRSGVLGSLSFLIISSLIAASPEGSSNVEFAWTRGVAFMVGCFTAIVVNWILWPFVARHELRKSISAMVLHCAIIYRRVIAKYMYYNEGDAPRREDVIKSEMLEGRLREGFVRMRQLMKLTRHEIRVRAPFDPVPYSALIDTCEHFFDLLVEVRQSSLSFATDPKFRIDDSRHDLLALRRDAVAAIQMNLYIVAGAIRSQRPLPRYFPSAALARQRLIDAMEVIEAEEAQRDPAAHQEKQRWQDLYRYAYSGALTDVVARVQQLEAYTRAIVGEIGLDRPNSQID